MDPLQFLDVAGELAVATREGDWRSAVSRAYYAAFHVTRNVLRQAGFSVPTGDQCHTYLYYRLNNAGDTQVQQAGGRLRHLRQMRNQADYDLDIPCDDQQAMDAVHRAIDVTDTLAALAGNPALLAQVTQTIRDYELLAYGSTTWQAP